MNNSKAHLPKMTDEDVKLTVKAVLNALHDRLDIVQRTPEQAVNIMVAASAILMDQIIQKSPADIPDEVVNIELQALFIDKLTTAMTTSMEAA